MKSFVLKLAESTLIKFMYRIEKERSNRAFTPAGLKVVFHFLLYEESIKTIARNLSVCIEKNYKLVPDKDGLVKIYQKFWYQEPQNTNIAPPLLVNADLTNQGDKRSRETANSIYKQYFRLF